MLVNFNIEDINKLLENFYTMTKLSITLYDDKMNVITFYPEACPNYCALIKFSQKGAIACNKSDLELCKKSFEQKTTVFHYCHAGLADVAAPIIYNDVVLGYLMFGQVLDEEQASKHPADIEHFSEIYNINKDKLQKAYNEIKVFSKDTIKAAMYILQMCTCYLYTSNFISPEKNMLAVNIESYINKNLKENISVERICEEFDISKNKLYQISENYFGKPFAHYITDKRIAQAKFLLETTSDPIYIISERIGIPDYNYFTKVFKKTEGLTPSHYRQKHLKKNI